MSYFFLVVTFWLCTTVIELLRKSLFLIFVILVVEKINKIKSLQATTAVYQVSSYLPTMKK